MPRFFYRPVSQQGTSGYSQLGEQLGAGLQQGVNNYLGVRAKAAEDRIRETEAARQREREDFADSVMRAQSGIEEGPAPMAGLDIFEGRGIGMGGPRKPSPLAMGQEARQGSGVAASLFAKPALETMGSQGRGGMGGQMEEREPGLLERYAASGPDADYTTFSSGDRQFHMLRPEAKAARERASQFGDYQAKARFDQELGDQNEIGDAARKATAEAADRARQNQEFEDTIGAAAAALVQHSGGRMTLTQAEHELRAEHALGTDYGTFMPPAPKEPVYHAPVQWERVTDKAGQVWQLNPVTGERRKIEGIEAPLPASSGGGADPSQITLNQALSRVRAMYPNYAGSITALPPDVEEMLAQRLVEGEAPVNLNLEDPNAIELFRRDEQNRRAASAGPGPQNPAMLDALWKQGGAPSSRTNAGGAAGGAGPAPASAPDTPPSTAPAGQQLSSEDIEQAKVDPAFASWLMMQGYAPTLWRP